jgi:hypothetical protein
LALENDTDWEDHPSDRSAAGGALGEGRVVDPLDRLELVTGLAAVGVCRHFI